MTPNYPWIYEPCSPEDVCDPTGQPWAHAVRGRKPQRPSVIGYGHTPDEAEDHAVHEAHHQDAREVLGERGEVVTAIEFVPLPHAFDMTELRKAISEWSKQKVWELL